MKLREGIGQALQFGFGMTDAALATTQLSLQLARSTSQLILNEIFDLLDISDQPNSAAAAFAKVGDLVELLEEDRPIGRLLADDGPMARVLARDGVVDRLTIDGGALDRLTQKDGAVDRALADGGLVEAFLAPGGLGELLVSKDSPIAQLTELTQVLAALGPDLQSMHHSVAELRVAVGAMTEAVNPLSDLVNKLPKRLTKPRPNHGEPAYY